WLSRNLYFPVAFSPQLMSHTADIIVEFLQIHMRVAESPHQMMEALEADNFLLSIFV
ncbi:1356_t:CDS:2, partial [Funneliformis geosporum]